jgi:hypothetical protein
LSASDIYRLAEEVSDYIDGEGESKVTKRIGDLADFYGDVGEFLAPEDLPEGVDLGAPGEFGEAAVLALTAKGLGRHALKKGFGGIKKGVEGVDRLAAALAAARGP